MIENFVLGIDTSNYKTSVAVVSNAGKIVYNLQQYLSVKKGEKGLRQSDALFQHVNNLPDLIEHALADDYIRNNIKAVSVSSRPRSVQGSYMPVFNAGISAGKLLSAALGSDYFEFSHQEGHIAAVKFFSKLKNCDSFISFHFSGGTTEALLVQDNEIKIIGGSMDISFGQLLDRVGVSLGMNFPCGEQMDKIASDLDKPVENILPRIKVSEGYFNLSGIETKCQRLVGTLTENALIFMIFERIKEAMLMAVMQLYEKYEIKDFLFAGGVSSSMFIRNHILSENRICNVYFGQAELSTDNAVGTAVLGGENIWP